MHHRSEGEKSERSSPVSCWVASQKVDKLPIEDASFCVGCQVTLSSREFFFRLLCLSSFAHVA